MSSRLKKRYNTEIKGQLNEQFKFANPMQIPRLLKIVLHMGIAEVTKEKTAIQDHLNEMTALAGQKAVVTLSKKSVANFKLREGVPIGIKVTLRSERMYDFMDRFVNIVCPCILDFRGFNAKADGSGNFSLGITDQQIFPEVDLDAVKRTQGMHVTFVTTAANDEECLELLRLMGLPLKDRPVVVATAA